MDKLSEFFLRHFGSGEAQPAAPLPALSAAEEEDVLSQLGVDNTPESSTQAMDLILSNVKNVHEFSLATGEAAKEAENDEDYTDYGTVIIKTKSGKSTEGTLRLKKGDTRFGSIVFRGGDVEASDLPSDAFSTIRVIETAASEQTPLPWATTEAAKSPTPSNESNFLWRAPETWEVNIIALERGEWGSEMPEEAFRKYKKERPKLGGLFRGESRFYDQSSLPPSASSPSLFGSAPATLSRSNDELANLSLALDSISSQSASSPSIDSDSTPSGAKLSHSASSLSTPTNDKSKNRKSGKKASKSADKSKEKSPESKEASKSSSSSSALKEERKWAVFRRSRAQRMEEDD